MNKLTLLLSILVFATVVAVAQPPMPSSTPDAAAEKRRADQLQARFNDYANFKRYAEANAKEVPASKDVKRVVFFGDSITDGWKLAEYFPGKPYINRGISGQTTPQMLLRMRADVIAHKPAAMLLLAGTNDIAGNTGAMTNEQIQDNYRSIAELAKANGIKMIFASILPVSDYNKNAKGEIINRTTQRPPERILALNEWLKDYCAANKLIYLDYFSATVDDKGFLKPELAGDGLHPNAEGYKIMQKLAEAAIAKALK